MASESPNRIVQVDGRRRRPWALVSQENLLNAAVEEIARVGFAKARLVDIAKRAGMTAGSVYTWFEDKEHLFQAALEHSLSEQLRKNTEAFAGTGITDSFLHQIAVLVPRNHVDDHPTDIQQLLIECYYAAWRDPRARGALMEGIEEHHRMFVRVFENAQRDGHLTTEVKASNMASFLLAMHTGLAMLTLAGAPRIPDHEWPDIYVRIFNAFRP